MSEETKDQLSQMSPEVLESMYRYLRDEYNRLLLLKSEVERTIDTLNALKKADTEEIGPLIIPVTGYLSLLVPKVKGSEVLFLMGSNIYAKMSPDRALEEAKSRLEEVEKAIDEVTRNMARIQHELEKLKGAKGAR